MRGLRYSWLFTGAPIGILSAWLWVLNHWLKPRGSDRHNEPYPARMHRIIVNIAAILLILLILAWLYAVLITFPR